MLALLSLLSACATRPPPATQSYDAHQSALAILDHWRVDGKIGLRQNDRGGSASLQWEQRGASYAVHLHGPLGVGSVYITGDDHKVLLRDKHGDHSAANAEALIAQLTGWQIPVSPIRYWAKGMPAPNLTINRKRVADGRLSELQQGGWTIAYSNYSLVQGIWLPGKIIMSRPQARLTLLQKQWQLL